MDGRIRDVWTQIFLYPHKKFADTKISGYVCTGPNLWAKHLNPSIYSTYISLNKKSVLCFMTNSLKGLSDG